MNEKKSEIVNYMETLVYEMLDEVISETEVCKCNHCRMDIAAIALNSLSPKYVVTNSGKLYTKINMLQQQFEVDVLSAVTRASIIVKNNPRHES